MKKLAAIFILNYQLVLAQTGQNRMPSQIQRNPQPKPEDYLTDLSITPPRPAKLQQAESVNVEAYLARGVSKMILEINKIAPTISQGIARADNTVYGPVTIAAAMALLLLGSLGKTFNELSNFWAYSIELDIHNNPSTFQEDFGRFLTKLQSTSGINVGQTVNFATGIFVQRGYNIRPEYEQASRMLYRTNVIPVDFQSNPQMAQKLLNNWVSERTNKKIPVLLAEPPPPQTKAIIASVLYFKAPWEYPFFEGHTKARPFYTNGRKNPTNKMAQMMLNGGEFPYYKDNVLGVEIMGFPYKGGRTSMYVILPNDSNVEKLKRLENVITASDIERLVSSTKITESVILFPKMRLENTLDLSETLRRMGVDSLFNSYTANLGLLSSGFMQKEPEAPFVNSFASRIRPPISPTLPPKDDSDDDERLIFTRFGDNTNCQNIYDPVTNKTTCIFLQDRFMGPTPLQSLDNLRQILETNPGNSNPELYADEVIHKVFIDITESGTEAAAATGVSINRSGGRVTFRVDMPFLFFIFQEDTKTILFFGSVKTPTPSTTS